jgi:hypothetical protein
LARLLLLVGCRIIDAEGDDPTAIGFARPRGIGGFHRPPDYA